MIDDLDDDTNDYDETGLETEAEVTCPYCGEEATISVDSGGGDTQTYVEDCPVCCRPWQVHLSFGVDGEVEVWLEEAAS
jgi:hypothetical protein